MLNALRRRLAVICIVMTSAVFAVFMATVAVLMESQYRRMNDMLFDVLLSGIVSRLQSENLVDGDWLAQLEVSQDCVISLENNGSPMRFRGGRRIDGRDELVERVRDRAFAAGFDYQVPPEDITSPVQTVFSLEDTGGQYRCALVKIPIRENWFSVTLAANISGENRHILRQRVLYGGLSLAVLAALCALSWWFTGKAVRPTAHSMERQREFVAAASHELKSPLAVIGATASAIRMMPEKSGELAVGIENECGRMGRLVNDLLLLANSDTTGWKLCLAPLELDTVLIDAVEKYAELAGAMGFTLELELPDEMLPHINGDSEWLGQLFSILIDNALSHSGKGGEIRVRVRAAPRSLTVEVIDHGEGIPPDLQERIFERFFRVDQSRTDKRHFGLGLAVAKELARLHGAAIQFAETEGGGCTFRVIFPLVD